MSEATCTVVMYHYVRDTWKTPFPEIKALAVDDFISQLNWLARQYQIIDYPTFEAARQEGNSLAGSYALLTFDDGFVDHYQTVFPLLKERGLSGIFFLATSTIGSYPQLLNVHKTHFLLAKLGADTFATEVQQRLEKLPDDINLARSERVGIYRYDAQKNLDVKRLLNYELPFPIADYVLTELFEHHLGDSTSFARELYLSPERIREMADAGMIFGGHTKNHRVLSRLNYEEQHAELDRGVQLIQDLTGQQSVPFCYPYGHTHTYNNDTIAALAALDYSVSFNTVRRSVRFGTDNRYELPRFDTKDLPPFKKIRPNAKNLCSRRLSRQL
ncbi:MAG: polysaccharide deacetylase family protein [Xenococcaceae cyanobacterium]